MLPSWSCPRDFPLSPQPHSPQPSTFVWLTPSSTRWRRTSDRRCCPLSLLLLLRVSTSPSMSAADCCRHSLLCLACFPFCQGPIRDEHFFFFKNRRGDVIPWIMLTAPVSELRLTTRSLAYAGNRFSSTFTVLPRSFHEASKVQSQSAHVTIGA